MSEDADTIVDVKLKALQLVAVGACVGFGFSLGFFCFVAVSTLVKRLIALAPALF